MLSGYAIVLNNPDATTYDFVNGWVVEHGSPISINLSSLRHLQHLTIYSHIYFYEYLNICISPLPALIEMLKTAPSLRHVNIDLYVDLPPDTHANFDAIDFSPLTALAESCPPFHIDLYIWANSWDFGCLLEVYQGLLKLTDQGTLIIHEDDTAPTFRDMYSRSTLF